MFYTVSYTETLNRAFVVEADSEDEARDKVVKAVERGCVVLNGDDYVCGEVDDVSKADDYDFGAYPKLNDYVD